MKSNLCSAGKGKALPDRRGAKEGLEQTRDANHSVWRSVAAGWLDKRGAPAAAALPIPHHIRHGQASPAELTGRTGVAGWAYLQSAVMNSVAYRGCPKRRGKDEKAAGRLETSALPAGCPGDCSSASRCPGWLARAEMQRHLGRWRSERRGRERLAGATAVLRENTQRCLAPQGRQATHTTSSKTPGQS